MQITLSIDQRQNPNEMSCVEAWKVEEDFNGAAYDKNKEHAMCWWKFKTGWDLVGQ